MIAGCGGGGGSDGQATSGEGTPIAAQTPTSDPATSGASAPGAADSATSPATEPTTALVLPDEQPAAAAPAPAANSGEESNATVTTQAANATAATTTSTLVISARGVLLNNLGPTVEVRVNGQAISSLEVRTTAFASYTVTVPSLAGGGALDIVYTNDAAAGGVDRNLWLASVSVDGVPYLPTDSGVVYDRGTGASAFDGVDTLPGQQGMFWNGAMRFRLGMASQSSATSSGVYVDAIDGNDTNPGTQAQPWKTLAKAAIATRLSAGQAVYLRCGRVWRESLALNATQLLDGNRIAGYGTECATATPVISGADDFSTGWTKNGNLWSRAVPAGTPQIARLFVAGVPQSTARWPNKPASGEGYALVATDAAASTTGVKATVADAGALTTRDLVNATVQVRTSAWTIETRSASGFDATSRTVQLATALRFAADVADGYVLQNKLWMLDAPGEFFHDVANNRLYVYPSDAGAQVNLNAYSVEGAVRDTPLAVAGRSNLTIAGITVKMGRADGISIANAPGAVVEGVTSSFNGGAGLYAVQDIALPAPTIRNGRFEGNWTHGINAQPAGAAQIVSNVVIDTGIADNAGGSTAGIYGGNGSQILNNRVDGTAYHGIRFSGTGNTLVSGNTVSRYCLRLADCGGIYTWNGAKLTGATQVSTVAGNQVLGATANAEGAPGPGNQVVAGIFLDDFSYGVNVRSNVVMRMPFGINVHNGASNTIDSNDVWQPTKAALVASMDQNDRDWLVNNVFKYNRLVPLKTAVDQFPQPPSFGESYPIWFFNNLSGGSSIQSGVNRFVGNQVVRLDGNADGVHAWIRSNTQDTRISSAQWASFNPGDAPTALPYTFALYALNLGPELVSGGGFDSGMGAWTTFFDSAGTGGRASAATGVSGCSGTCVTLVSGTKNDYVASPSFTMVPGAQYLYAYTAAFGGAGTIQWPYISQIVTPWASMATNGFTSSVRLSGASGQVIRYEGFFNATSSALARVNLQVATPGVPISFDNVSVRQITGYSFSSTSDWSAVATAPVGSTATVTCASLGWGSGCTAATIDGTPVTLPQTLLAGTSRFYLRTDSGWRR